VNIWLSLSSTKHEELPSSTKFIGQEVRPRQTHLERTDRRPFFFIEHKPALHIHSHIHSYTPFPQIRIHSHVYGRRYLHHPSHQLAYKRLSVDLILNYKIYCLAPLRRLICLDDCQLTYLEHKCSDNYHPRWNNEL